MARRKAATGDAGADKVKPSEDIGITPANKLKSLLKKAKDTSRDTRELSGSLGQAVANAVEHDHLHRKAFNIVKTLNAMEPEKLAETMYHLEHYLEVSGINERVAKVGRLDLGDQREDTDEAEGADKPGLKVHEGGRGREVAEAAGA